ncbi:MAG TPA: hypothetical protein VM782_21830 [Stellaceae bacterium]|nr:hypothetical protein [Stellaceae bacterium]
MIEHCEWVDDRLYNAGINGQRIAIVGYSHYLKEGSEDSRSVTKDTINDVIRGRRFSFFSSISAYFGDPDVWKKVLFFNFLPNAIGYREDRYKVGDKRQLERARIRVTRLIDQYSPNKLLVFTRKGWSEFPKTQQESKGELLSLSTCPSFTWGSYRSSRCHTMGFGLRHPQYAPTDVMISAVSEILSMPLQDGLV